MSKAPAKTKAADDDGRAAARLQGGADGAGRQAVASHMPEGRAHLSGTAVPSEAKGHFTLTASLLLFALRYPGRP